MHLVSLALTAVLAIQPTLGAPRPSAAEDSPSKVHLGPRAAITSFCGQNDLVDAADFILYNNLWGEAAATSGSQCTYLDYDDGDAISWQTSWTWEGGSSDVKSYANAVLNVGATQLSAITGLPTTWNWSYTGDSIVGDVSYDAFFSATASTTATHAYEVMVWLAAYGGAQPIGYGSGAIASPVIGGITWDLYQGTNTWTVFSFVAASTTTEYSGDINDFFTYLTANQGVPTDYYLQTIGAGTEPFTGSDAWFTVSPYTISLST